MKAQKDRVPCNNKKPLRSLCSLRYSRPIVMILGAAFCLALAPFASAQIGQCTPIAGDTPSPNTPLNDLGQRTYSPLNSPAQGGLYPGGFNQRPAGYNAQGVSIAQNNITP